MFKNKAQNLEFLNSYKIDNVEVPKFFIFDVSDWKKNKKILIEKINKKLNKKICIRSSYYKEDNSKSSLAGKFDSFIDIKNNKKNIINSIENLINQYQSFDAKKKFFLKNYFIIQNYIQSSICSGVITNYSLGDGAPYYSINYNDLSNSTLSVTAGDKDSFRVLHVSRNSNENIRSTKFKKIIEAVKRIEKIYNYKPVDIEFALGKNLKVYILQIRPISTVFKWKSINKNKFQSLLNKSESKYQKIKKRNKRYGKKAVFGLMPDWNPAEIIGFQPNLFSYSLYEFLVTNEIWATARNQMGYKKLKKPKLMYSFSGKPFVDLRMSFNSLLPKSLNNRLEKKITTFWIEEIIKKPYYHDKIEFEITDNCFYFGLNDKISKKYNFLNKKEKINFYNSLKILTNKILKDYKKNFLKMNNDIVNLEKIRTKIIKKYILKKNDEIKFSKELFKECKTQGLIPFAKQARNAFIAKKILISLVDINVLSKKSYFNILSKLKTISHDYILDQKNLDNNKIQSKKFIKKYFHLRPNSYDISNKRYKEKISINEMNDNEINILLNFDIKRKDNLITLKEYKNINSLLKKNRIETDTSNLLNFCINSLKLRENYKFMFSRTLSDGIQLLRLFSKKNKINNNIANVSIDTIYQAKNKKGILLIKKKSINNLKLSEYYRYVKLPYLIVSNNDFFVSSILLSKPNFISDRNITGKIVILDGKSKNINLKNKIAVIENADPGFDWIFSKRIKGLITKFGGVNSHMSIRCEELNMPAIIGFGEDNFRKLKNNSAINIDCKLQKINIGELKD
jgi:phosphohistidine swiveling domain-containing protein